jgi:hypothetical protein
VTAPGGAFLVAKVYGLALSVLEEAGGAAEVEDFALSPEHGGEDASLAGQSPCLFGCHGLACAGGGHPDTGEEGVVLDCHHDAGGGATVGGQVGVDHVLQHRLEGDAAAAG